MAHMEKFTRGQIQGLVIHLERLTDKHSNPDIDIERTKDNYDLCSQEGTILDRLRDRLEDVHVLDRKNVNIAANWVVTLPQELKDLSSEEIKEFFQSVVNFSEDRYGKENIVGAWVHLDETTPHLHLTFVPVVTDKKKNI